MYKLCFFNAGYMYEHRNLFLLILTLIFIGSQAATPQNHENPAVHSGLYPKYNVKSGQDRKIIEKGEYLAKLGDCIACHTKDHDKPYSGGLGIYTPFGTFYAPNITPDKKFGIGGWTLEEFTNALRHGKAPDGSNYFPVFPYLYYNRITDEDMKALKAYFDAIPAISEPSQEHEVGFPFNIRFLQYFWKILFFYPYEGVYTPDMTKSEKWNRGAYIVEGLAHC